MNDPGPPIDSTVMARSSSKNLSLLTLPAEVLDRIFQLVDKPDLVNVRLVSRSFCAIANRPFALKNFTSCHHVVTRHSFETLLAISAHSVFGTYIKRIVLNPARAILERCKTYQEHDEGHVADDSFVESGRFGDLMHRILANIKQHSSSITIGIDESNCFEHGSPGRYFYSQYTTGRKYYGVRELCANELGIVYRTPETLELVIAEICAAEIGINGLEFNLTHRRRSGDNARVRLHKSTAGFLKSRDSPIDLCFTWFSNGVLKYNHLHSRLCLSSSPLLTTREHPHPDGQFVEETVQLLADTSFTDLRLQKLKVDCLPYLDVYFTQFLQTVTLNDIRFGSNRFAQFPYSDLFQRLSKLPGLKHCRFDTLKYTLGPTESPWYQYDIQLASGRYPTDWDSLLLIFPDGKDEFEIRGIDTHNQLEDLAAYTAAAEKRKIYEVEEAGKLDDYRVIGADTPILEDIHFDYDI